MVRSQLRFAAAFSVLAAGLFLGSFGSAVAVAAPGHSGGRPGGADQSGQRHGPHGNPSDGSLRNDGVAGSPRRAASGSAGGTVPASRAVPASQAVPDSTNPQAFVTSAPPANANQSQVPPASAEQFSGAGSRGSQSGGAEVAVVAPARPAGGQVTAQQSSGQAPVSGLVQPPAVDAAAAPAAQPSAAVINPSPSRDWADELGLPRVELPTLPGWLPAPVSASTDLDFGIGGMLIMSAAGVAVGYRQARASRDTGGHRTTRWRL